MQNWSDLSTLVPVTSCYLLIILYFCQDHFKFLLHLLSCSSSHSHITWKLNQLMLIITQVISENIK